MLTLQRKGEVGTSDPRIASVRTPQEMLTDPYFDEYRADKMASLPLVSNIYGVDSPNEEDAES
jgi:hypothetical protein